MMASNGSMPCLNQGTRACGLMPSFLYVNLSNFLTQHDPRLVGRLGHEALAPRSYPDATPALAALLRLRLDPVGKPDSAAQVTDGVGVSQDRVAVQRRGALPVTAGSRFQPSRDLAVSSSVQPPPSWLKSHRTGTGMPVNQETPSCGDPPSHGLAAAVRSRCRRAPPTADRGSV